MRDTSPRTRTFLLALAALGLSALLGRAAIGDDGARRVGARDPAPRDAIEYWVAGTMDRVGETDPPSDAREARLFAARGEYEPFQVVVRASGDGLSGVRAVASDLVGPGGAHIAPAHLTLYLERYVNVPRSSTNLTKGGHRSLPPGRYPDILIPMSADGRPNPAAMPFRIAPGKNQPIWIDLLIPRGIRGGRYTGAMTITADQGRATVPLIVEVWEFDLPERPTLRSSFGLHGPRASDPAYDRLLVEHRLMPAHVPAAEVRAGDPALSTTGLPFWSHRRGCRMDPPPQREAIRTAASAYPEDLPVHVYVADEIREKPCTFRPVIEWARRIHQASPSVKTLVTIEPTPELLDDGAGTGRSAVDVWVVLPRFFDPSAAAFREACRKQDEIWSYTALVQDKYSPKWQLDFPPIDYRITPGFLSHALNLTGILYWAVDFWNADPWHDVYYREGSYAWPGEGLLVYPGEPVGVRGGLPSMRLKWIREGVEDFEYLALLEHRGRAAFARDATRGVATDWHEWTKDPAALAEARLRIGRELDRLAREDMASRSAEPRAKRPPSAGERRP